jgi:hypothetical protein
MLLLPVRNEPFGSAGIGGNKMAKSQAKKSKWITNVDDTSTLRMSWLGREDEITGVFPTYESCLRVQDLFTYFGIDSAKAGKPMQSDIDLLAARKAVR